LLAEDISAELWISRAVNSVVLISTLETHLATGTANTLDTHLATGTANTLDTHLATGTANTLDAYIYFPYQPTVLCPQVKDVVLQDHWILDSRNRSHFLHNTSLFLQK
jgi:hypothetical protein